MSAALNADRQETDDLGAVEVANHLLERVGVSRKIRSIKECNDEYFLALYLAITGESPPGFTSSPHGNEDRIRNCQAVIDSLANEILEIDLSHIEGRDIVDGNIAAIANLLEIFMGLLEYIYEELEREDNQYNKENGETEKEDSNLLPYDHDILSDVIEEEFGGSLMGKGKRKLRGGSNKPDLMERYFVPKEPPTRDTDTESVSLHDFTQDSLYNPNPKRSPHRRMAPTQAQPELEMHPFAYFSSSSSNSTEDLAKEAELYAAGKLKSGTRDVRSASTSKLREKLPEHGNKQRDDHLRKTDPTLCTTLSRERNHKVDSLTSSMSSPKWPSILSAKELKTSKGSNPTGYEEVGARPRGLLPGEVNKINDTSSDSSSSVVHKHTHHHYYHDHSASKFDERKRSAKTTSLVGASTSKDRGGGDGFAESARKTGKDQHLRDKDVDIKKNSLRSGDASILEGSIQRSAPIRVRSVQTSVSDMPAANVSSNENKTETKAGKAASVLHERIRSDQSSTSELNELLNTKKKKESAILGKEAKVNKRSDALKELDQKLEEVRAAVKAIEGAQLPSTEVTEKNLKGFTDFFRDEETRFLSPPNEEKISDLREESICSDSEFDYGLARDSLRRKPEDNKPRDRGREELIQQRLSQLQDGGGEKRDPFDHISRKKVHFKDHLRDSRDERLERLIRSLKKEDRENEDRLENVKKQYSRDLKETQQKQKHKTKTGTAGGQQTRTPLQNTANSSASKLARIYGQRSRKPQREVSKQRKRSASCSPVPRSRRRGRLVIQEDDILPVMEDEFPHLYLSPVTARMMWQKQMRQVSNLTKAAQLRKPTKIQKQIEEAGKKQEKLMNIMKKELEHNKRLKESKLKSHEQRQVKNKLRERRLASARARRYYDEYQVRMRARMLKRRTKEEKIFKTLFEDALQIQKQRVRELRTYTMEQREMDAQRKQNELESIENFYRDQFSMMAETVSRERYDLQVREKAQRKVVDGMRKGIRQRMENDIKELQEELVRDEDSAHFRQLDADNLRKELQLATYKVRM